MAFLHFLILYATFLAHLSLCNNEHLPKKCFGENSINNYCECETLISTEHIMQTEERITCYGSKAFEAATESIKKSKKNAIFIEFHISNTTIDIILYEDLKIYPYLKHLSMTRTHIKNIENDAFRKQDNLQILDLSLNELSILKSSMFENLIKLKNLTLSNNKIYLVEQNTFHTMSMLLHLDLSGNDLTEIDSAWFAGSKNLKTLFLKNNHIQSLEANGLQNLLNLQNLDLSFNDIKEITPATFFHLKSLKFLSLAMNQLETLSESAFKGNTKLEKVNLTGNLWNCDKKLLLLNDWLKKYEADKEGALCVAPPEFQNQYLQRGLDVLNLQIKVQESPLCNATMCNCIIEKDKVVITVDCSNRGFTRLPETVPYKTKQLNLCNNNIKSLTIDHIDTTLWADVSFLHLNNNVIDSLKGLEGTWLLRKLVALHVSNNQLTEIPIHVLEQFRGGLLDELYLSGNPWNCDCNTVRFQTWLQDSYKYVRELDGIRCSSNNGAFSNQVIVQLPRSQLCPQHEQLVNYLDILNGLMAVAIILIVVKLAYDYMLQKRTGKLPRFFSLNLS